MDRTMRVSTALILFTTALWLGSAFDPAVVLGQTTVTPKDGTSYEVIDTPPPAAPAQVPSAGVVLEQPGRVMLVGQPVRIHFQSPTDGVSFHLRMGGVYSSISGVSFGMGWGGWGWGGYGGWGWGGYGGWGMGGYGAMPYYGEVVTKSYQPICEAPCDATLLSGRHRLALSLDGNTPVEIPQAIDLSSDAIVEGRYIDKRHIRKAGWAVFAAGAVAGMALMFASVNYHYDPFYGQQIRYRPMFYTGVGLFVSSIVAGSVLASRNDEVSVNVYPE
jgi:hypothetical protein